MSVDAGANGTPLVEVDHLKVFFPIKQGIVIEREVARVHAVNDVTLSIAEGETLGLVGESGCGKTTMSRAVMRLIDSTDGSIRFHGDDITKAGRRQIHGLLLDPPEYLATAKVFDLLLAVPKYGRVKVNRILTHCRISPSKTIGGLSERQRNELVSYLRR